MEHFLLWDGWRAVSGVAAAIGLFACLWFVVRFQQETNGAWWRHPDGQPNPFGRFLFFRKLLLSALFGLVLVNRFAPGWNGQDFVTALIFMAFALQTFVPYRLLVQAQREFQEEESHGR